MAILVLRPSTLVDAIDRAINRLHCNRSMYTHWMQSQILISFPQWHIAMKSSMFLLLVFVLLFLYRVEVVLRPSRWIARSIDWSIGCYKSSIRIDYKVRFRVIFSGNIKGWRYYYFQGLLLWISACWKASAAGYNLRNVRQTRQPNFKTKTKPRKALWVTLAL